MTFTLGRFALPGTFYRELHKIQIFLKCKCLRRQTATLATLITPTVLHLLTQ